MAAHRNNSKLPIDGNAKPIPVLKPLSAEKLAITSTAASAATRNLSTDVLRLIADVPCWYRLDGTATTSHVYLPADTIEYVKVDPDDTLSVICASGVSGSMYISECI